ncbi:uncharacterized protein LOC110750777 [Prunus avium]|uniref:Uncharacterized protein LOC110750777 n=1 Tax=Prunus avium TaxID=42229 RepID=A0A6P5RUN7_PRUAV|nr:uncharacterized protein LOC110750777 [Prunus avium]
MSTRNYTSNLRRKHLKEEEEELMDAKHLMDEEEELMDAKHLVDVEDLEAEDEQELNAFYGGSNSVSLGQLVIRDQLHAPPSPHGMSTPKILYLCFGEYMAGNKTLYSIQALCLHSFPPVQTLKAKELAYIRGEGLPLRMGCGLFGSNIVFLGGVESRFDCYSGDFTTYPRKDIYTFDTKHPYTCEVFNNSSLRQGKSRPFLVQYYDKL